MFFPGRVFLIWKLWISRSVNNDGHLLTKWWHPVVWKAVCRLQNFTKITNLVSSCIFFIGITNVSGRSNQRGSEWVQNKYVNSVWQMNTFFRFCLTVWKLFYLCSAHVLTNQTFFFASIGPTCPQWTFDSDPSNLNSSAVPLSGSQETRPNLGDWDLSAS